MQAQFMHIADCHLGYWQYKLKERYNDFAKTFYTAMDIAVNEEVDFVLLAGDLFDKRSIDALTLNQAISGLDMLRRAGIPCIAVEGNHELAYYQDRLGWMGFLDIHGYLKLLNPRFEGGRPQLKPYDRHEGSYIDVLPWLRIHGLKYLGAGTPQALKAYGEALNDLPDDGIEYTIFMTHAGLEGEVTEQMGGLSHSQIGLLRQHVDYLALGHIHKPYERDNWVYNPGSLETCSVAEARWPDRGYYLVDVNTATADADEPKHTATRMPVPRRPFHRFPHRMDDHTSPDEFYAELRSMLERKARDLGMQGRRRDEEAVVEVQLTGVLPFDPTELDIGRVEEMVLEHFHPLHVIVRNLAAPVGFVIETGEGMSRSALERNILEELFSRDVQYRAKHRHWAQAALDIKRLALESASDEAIVDELKHQMALIDDAPEDDDLEDLEDLEDLADIEDEPDLEEQED